MRPEIPMIIYDIEIVQGGTFTKDMQLESPEGIVSLDGYTVQSQIRPKPGSDELTQQIACVVENDTVYLYVDAADTAQIAPGKYYYDVAFIHGGIVEYMVGGKFTVWPRSTVVE